MINSFVSGASVAIKVNDDVDRYFQTLKGLRQGDPLSPSVSTTAKGTTDSII
jgi:hypothetical protein